MVLFIYHDAQLVPEKHRSPGPDRMLGVEARQFLAHQVALVEKQPVGRGQLVHPNQYGLVQPGGCVNRVLYMRQDPQPLAIPGACPEREPFHVPR